MNKYLATGRLTNDPALRTVTVGGEEVSVCDFSIAINDPQKKKKTVFIDCSAWRGKAETIAQYMKKGRSILVEGELEIREYKQTKPNKDGVMTEYSYQKPRLNVSDFEFNDSNFSSSNNENATSQPPYMAQNHLDNAPF